MQLRECFKAFRPQWINPEKAAELQRPAHTLKSNARNFGAVELAELCQEVENRAKAGSMDVCDLLKRIDAECTKVRNTPQV